MTHNPHKDCNHVSGPGIHLALGNVPFLLRYRNQEWFMEWHYRFGPSVLNKRTNSPLNNQPGEKSMFWLVAQWWHDQGGRVIDGVGAWDYPPTIEQRCRIVGRTIILDENGPDVFRHWQGYEQWPYREGV